MTTGYSGKHATYYNPPRSLADRIWVVRKISREIVDYHIPNATDELDAMKRWRSGEGTIGARSSDVEFEISPLEN